MKILLYGMQSSGASLVAFFLGQAPRTVTIVDLWNRELMPPLEADEADHIVAKCVATTLYDFQDHVRSFGPDRTMLVLRNPAQNYVALRRKAYANESGTIDEKFVKLEQEFLRRDQFDVVLTYEDFVREQDETTRRLQAAGFPVRPDFYEFPRDRDEMKAFTFEQLEWCRQEHRKRWGFGNIRGQRLHERSLYKHVPRSVARHVERLCPSVCQFYEEAYSEGPSARAKALWYDVVIPGYRAWTRRVQRIVSPSQG